MKLKLKKGLLSVKSKTFYAKILLFWRKQKEKWHQDMNPDAALSTV